MAERSALNVSLTPELDRLISDEVSSGRYQTASEVIREALRLLEQHDDLRELKLAELRRKVKVGLDELDRGEGVSGPKAMREVKEKLTKRKAKKR